MTKLFCDLCGNEVVAKHADYTLHLNDKAWSGTVCRSNSPNPTDGTWTPQFSITCKFEAEFLTKEKYGKIFPDLCAGCMARLARGLAEKLIGP